MSNDIQFENGIQTTWTTVENGIIDDTDHFDGLEKLTFIVCLRHAFQIGGQAHPSQVTIAKKVGCTDRTVRNHLSNLEKKGFLKKVGIHPETQTVIWRTVVPEDLRIKWMEEELERMKRKGKELPKDPEPNQPEGTKETIPHKEIVDYLNEKADKQFKSGSKATQDKIRARWNEGHRVEDFKKVIDNMVAMWKGDEKMDQYLRPATLFHTKFEAYLNTKPKTKGPSQRPPQQPRTGGKVMSEEERKAMLAEIGVEA
jgi:uncharacterized phage protein (TIGR02220 family)